MMGGVPPKPLLSQEPGGWFWDLQGEDLGNMQLEAISQGPVFGLTLLFNTLDLLVPWPDRGQGG